MKLIKRIGALLVTVAMLCSLLVFAPASTVTALEGAGIPGDAENLYWGCDVSFYNVSDNDYANGYTSDDSGADYSLVDFAAMKADGCDFVILRLGSEDSSGKYYDPHFVTYYNMAREADMDIGLYYYSYALTYAEAVEEAEFCIEVVESYDMYFEYPLYIDIEESDQLALGETDLSNVCYGWCETMENAGYFPGIYGNYTLYDGISTAVKNSYDTWIAWVSSADSMSSYTPTEYNLSDECGMWQYSFYGYEYDGIGLDMLDVNVAYKDYPAIMETYGYNNVGPSYENISKNSNYYPQTTAPGNDYDDDNTKLTDGNKGSPYGGETARYSCFKDSVVDIILDVGTSASYNTFKVYAAAGMWGVEAPTALSISVADSFDGPYTEVDATVTITQTGTTDGTYSWDTYLITATLNSGVSTFSTRTVDSISNQYVKFSITPVIGDDSVGTVWLDEIEVGYTPSATDEDGSGDSGSTDDTTSTVIRSIELTTTGSTVAGNTMFSVSVKSVNGDTSLASAAQSALLVQWWDESASTLYTTGTDVLEEGVVYDLYVKFTCNSGYSFSDSCVMTLTTANGTFTGEYYEAYSSSTARAYDFWITPSASGDSEDPVEKFVINSLEFKVSAGDPAVGDSVFSPTLVSVNGDASLLSYISEAHTEWYTRTGYTVTEYTGTVFEALNVGYEYDLYFSVTAASTAEFATDCTLSLTTNDKTHNATMYVYGSSSISYDIYFETETVVVPDQSVFITGFNTSIVAGAAQIFTPDFGTVSSSTANIIWTANLLAKYDEELEAYVVQSVASGGGSDSLSYDLADDEIFIAIHWDDSETDTTTQDNFNALLAVQPGMLLEFNNIDLESQTLGTNPTIEFYTFEGPIVSLGAKANEELCGIRFGATYNKVFGKGEVKDMGFLLISEYRLGDNTLDLDYASNSAIADYVVRVQACTISEYVEGKAFEDYTTFTFFASVVRLDRKGNEDDNIVAVPYIVYADGSFFLGEQMMNSYNGVLNGESSFA